MLDVQNGILKINVVFWLLICAFVPAEAQNQPRLKTSQRLSPFWGFVVEPNHPGCEFLGRKEGDGLTQIHANRNSSIIFVRSGKDGIACKTVEQKSLTKENLKRHPGWTIYFLLDDIELVTPEIVKIRSGDRTCVLKSFGSGVYSVKGNDISQLKPVTSATSCFTP